MQKTGWSNSILRKRCRFSLKITKLTILSCPSNMKIQLNISWIFNHILKRSQKTNSMGVYSSWDLHVRFLRKSKLSICPSDIKKGFVVDPTMGKVWAATSKVLPIRWICCISPCYRKFMGNQCTSHVRRFVNFSCVKRNCYEKECLPVKKH